MTTDISTETKHSLIEQVIVQGDLASLSSQARTEYLLKVCEGMGLNPLTKPFEYVRLNNKLTLYCTRSGTDQLRKVNKVSIKITSRENLEGVYIVSAQATTPDGRMDESTGAVSIIGLKGDALANACMKAETKAKRRVTLSICGLGWLEESEIESIPNAQRVSLDTNHDHQPVIVKEKTNQTENVDTYRIPFGKFKDKTLAEVGVQDLDNYIRFLYKKSDQDRKPIDPKSMVGVFCSMAEQFIDQQTHISSTNDQNYDMSEPPIIEDLPF